MNTRIATRIIGCVSGLILIAGLTVGASAAEPDTRAGLRLPELASELAVEQLNEAVFTSLTPFTIEEVPVRLPADQRLDNEPASIDAEPKGRSPSAR